MIPATSCLVAQLERWEDKHVRLLIECYHKFKHLFGRAQQTKKKIFDQIAGEFNSQADIFVTGEQCLRKWKKMESKQKEVEDNNNKTGNAKKTWKFHKEMEECIGENPNIKPVYILENSRPPSSSSGGNSTQPSDEDSDDSYEQNAKKKSSKSTQPKRPQGKGNLALQLQKCWCTFTVMAKRGIKWKRRK